MCGIIGYIGSKEAKDILIQGLKSLEYRGYDSSGLALFNQTSSKIEILKTQGKIVKLEEKIAAYLGAKEVVTSGKTNASSEFNSIVQERVKDAIENSTCGVGHTRWATHGKPNDINSHPHQDFSGDLAIVHNGIIKNYFQIKEELEAEGVEFRSETDTEVIAQLLSKYRSQGNDNIAAIRQTIKRLEGSYALAIIMIDKETDEQKIYLAKNQSPLVIGVGEDENYIASDSSTVLQFTDKILRLKDGQIAKLTAKDIKIEDLDGSEAKIEIHQSMQTSSILEKGPYKHFLIKEINEQPAVISTMLNTAIPDSSEPIKGFENLDIDFKSLNRIVFVACGSAYHAALVGKNLIELWAKVPVEVEVASEFCSKPSLVGAKDLVIGISQSGETADTLSAITSAKKNGAQVMALTNKSDSAIYDACQPNTVVTPAGIEVSVASTKAFTSQVLALYLFAIKITEERHGETMTKAKEELRSLPLVIDQAIERADSYYKQFIKYSSYRDFLFLSRGVNYPIALEGALKLKELSYIHATGYPSGEMKHGPIAILDSSVPVLSIAIDGESEYEHMIYKKALSNAEEARARMSPSLVIACDNNEDVGNLFDEVIRIPNISQLYSPIIATIPLQFLAYYIAMDLGKDVDQPRNLAKSVTVE